MAFDITRRRPMTVAEKIRNMTNYELATDLLEMFEGICEDGVPGTDWMLMWLEKPVEEITWER